MCDFLVLYVIIFQKIGNIRDFPQLSDDVLDQSASNSQKTIILHQQYEISADTIKNCSKLELPIPIISLI